ncbi:hypothetical protein GCM10019017_24590 [Streptomyces showdoensis]
MRPATPAPTTATLRPFIVPHPLVCGAPARGRRRVVCCARSSDGRAVKWFGAVGRPDGSDRERIRDRVRDRVDGTSGPGSAGSSAGPSGGSAVNG